MQAAYIDDKRVCVPPYTHSVSTYTREEWLGADRTEWCMREDSEGREPPALWRSRQGPGATAMGCTLTTGSARGSREKSTVHELWEREPACAGTE